MGVGVLARRPRRTYTTDWKLQLAALKHDLQQLRQEYAPTYVPYGRVIVDPKAEVSLVPTAVKATTFRAGPEYLVDGTLPK